MAEKQLQVGDKVFETYNGGDMKVLDVVRVTKTQAILSDDTKLRIDYSYGINSYSSRISLGQVGDTAYNRKSYYLATEIEIENFKKKIKTLNLQRLVKKEAETLLTIVALLNDSELVTTIETIKAINDKHIAKDN